MNLLKKITSFTILLFYSFCLGQKYHFDYFITTESKSNKDVNDKIKSFLSSSDYKNLLYFDKTEKKFIASIFDSETSYRHMFNVKEVGNQFVFEYSHSFDFTSRKWSFSHLKHTIDIQKLNDENYKIDVIDESRKRRSIVITLNVKLKEGDFQHIKLLNIDYSGIDEVQKKLLSMIGDKKFIVDEVVSSYSKAKNRFMVRTTEVIPYEVTIFLPEKLNFKEFVQ